MSTQALFSKISISIRYIGSVPKPSVNSKSLLVKIKATALNRADMSQREGKYPPPAGESDILGLEM